MSKLTLFNGNNFKFVNNNTVDLVLSDPPFNISKKSNFHTYEKNTIHSYQFDGESDNNWDTYSHEEFIEKLNEWATEWSRVLRKGGSFVIFCADSYISHLMEALNNNGLHTRRLITWRKNNAVPVNRAYMPTSSNEYIIVGVKKGKNVTFNADIPIMEQTIDDKIIESYMVADKVSTIVYKKVKEAILAIENSDNEEEHLRLVGETIKATLLDLENEAVQKSLNMYKTNKNNEQYLQACVPNYVQHPIKVGNRTHPTEKPVALLEYLISLYSKPGNTVLDSFGGSGSTGEAALNLGRDVIIIERETSFYEKLSQRLTPLSDQE